MPNQTLTLMAFKPRADVSVHVHAVDLPPELRAALNELFPPRHAHDALPTSGLKHELRRWLDHTVDLRSVRAGGEGPVRGWLIALSPVDLRRLCSVLAVWLRAQAAEADEGKLSRALGLLRPETFAAYAHEQDTRLFGDGGRPAPESSGLAFPALSAALARLLVGREIVLPDGQAITFARVAQGGHNSCELMSQVMWFEGEPYAQVLRLHTETLPVGQRVMLNAHVSTRRFITAPRHATPYLREDVQALVRSGEDCFRVVPYGYRRGEGLAWDARAKSLYELTPGAGLPGLNDYFPDMLSFAPDGQDPQILSPYSVSCHWANRPKVGVGIPIKDKAAYHEMLARELGALVEPVVATRQVRMRSLKPALGTGGEGPEERALANRMRLAECTGRDEVEFCLVGRRKDAGILELARQEILGLLGPEGAQGGVALRITELFDGGKLLVPLKSKSRACASARWRTIQDRLPSTDSPTVCIVVLPDKGHYHDIEFENARRKKEQGPEAKPLDAADPKTALRMGLALTGRLSQFLTPQAEGEDPSHRVRSAVLDALRQLGFATAFERAAGAPDPSLPVAGIHLYQSPNESRRAAFPLLVRMDLERGSVSAECPLVDEGRIPYWRMLLKLAEVSTGDGFFEAARAVGGRTLASMVRGMAMEAREREELLFVHSYGRVRQRGWWYGISDTRIADGRLTIGPEGEERDFSGLGTRLQVLRVRSGSNGEVPDYFTEEDHKGDRRSVQGIFPMGGYLYCLPARPKEKRYLGSQRDTRPEHPDWSYLERALAEYRLLTSDDEEKALLYAKYAETLRNWMVQAEKRDMVADLPAPLHLASLMEEYVWSEPAPKAKWQKR